jgi:acetate---CoA ligase (ADP-forming)
MQNTRTFSAERLRSLFEPQSIALVGASDKSAWSMLVHNNLVAGEYGGHVYYINPRSPIVHGRPAVPQLADIGETVDLAYIMVPPDAVLPVVQEMAEAGIHNAVVLTAGFAEVGDDGRIRQQELVRLAGDHDIAIIGPNCLGYMNVARRIEVMPNTCVHPLISGSVALLSQSGAVAGMLLNYAHEQPIGLSMLISTGNEAVLSICDIIDYAIEDKATRVIAIFAETLRRPDLFVAAAQRALKQGKPIVMLKTGRSELSARVAQAHTGALVGDDRVMDALFHQLGIIRVDSLEELMITANVLAQTGPVRGNRVGFVGISGGGCGLAADRAEQVGITFPAFTEQSKTELRTLLPALGPANNPLDTTGAAVTRKELFGQLLEVAGRDPNMDVLLCSMSIPRDEETAKGFLGDILAGMAKAMDSAPIPSFMIDSLEYETSAAGQAFIERISLPYLPGGIHQVIGALGKAAWWSTQYRAYQEKQSNVTESTELHGDIPTPGGIWSEWRVRELLERQGIPVIPANLVTTAEQATNAARAIGFPVALKVVSPDILHKSDIGGVRLHLRDEEEVQEAFIQIMDAASVITPTPHIEGALVSPMRTDGVELLVGVLHNSDWGQVLAVGLGGIWVEILNDTGLRVLPVSREDVRSMLDELKGAALFRGARSSKPADIDALVEVIYHISTLAQALQHDLESLEINPLIVDGSRIEALDALITWRRDNT